MINVSNWDEIRAHYEDYWNLRNKTPVVYLAAPKEGGSYDYEEPTSEQFWFDPKWNAGANRHSYENTFYALDGYPYVSPSLGPTPFPGFWGRKLSTTRRAPGSGTGTAPCRKSPTFPTVRTISI